MIFFGSKILARCKRCQNLKNFGARPPQAQCANALVFSVGIRAAFTTYIHRQGRAHERIKITIKHTFRV